MCMLAECKVAKRNYSRLSVEVRVRLNKFQPRTSNHVLASESKTLKYY